MWKKIAYVILFIFISLFSLLLLVEHNKPIIVEISSGSELLFFSGGNTTKNLQEERNCKYAINGSYFGKDDL